MAVLEEPIHCGDQASTGVDPEARKSRGWGREPGALYIGLFEQVKRPGGAVSGGGEDFLMGLIRGLRKGVFEGKDADGLYTRLFEQICWLWDMSF